MNGFILHIEKIAVFCKKRLATLLFVMAMFGSVIASDASMTFCQYHNATKSPMEQLVRVNDVELAIKGEILYFENPNPAGVAHDKHMGNVRLETFTRKHALELSLCPYDADAAVYLSDTLGSNEKKYKKTLSDLVAKNYMDISSGNGTSAYAIVANSNQTYSGNTNPDFGKTVGTIFFEQSGSVDIFICSGCRGKRYAPCANMLALSKRIKSNKTVLLEVAASNVVSLATYKTFFDVMRCDGIEFCVRGDPTSYYRTDNTIEEQVVELTEAFMNSKTKAARDYKNENREWTESYYQDAAKFWSKIEGTEITAETAKRRGLHPGDIIFGKLSIFGDIETAQVARGYKFRDQILHLSDLQ